MPAAAAAAAAAKVSGKKASKKMEGAGKSSALREREKKGAAPTVSR